MNLEFNIRFKSNPMAEWRPWMYLPPSEATIKILKKEVRKDIEQMREDGRFMVKRIGTVFYGEPVYAFQFLDGTEVYLDK